MIEIRRAGSAAMPSMAGLILAFVFVPRLHDPAHMGFAPARDHEDRIQPGTASATHGHRDMEIISYVWKGVGHKDSMGTGSDHRPGRRAAMSAGAECSTASRTGQGGVTDFLQIWIEPNVCRGHPPGYEQKHFDAADSAEAAPGCLPGRSRWLGDDPPGCAHLRRTVRRRRARGQPIAPDEAYLHIVRAGFTANARRSRRRRAENDRHPGDRAGARRDAEVLLFDLP